MEREEEPASTAVRREWPVRALLALLVAAVVVNVWSFVGEQRGDGRLRVRAARDIEELVARGPKAVRYRHGTYYRLARELHGATLHMDPYTARLHRWALEGLGEMNIVVSRRSVIRVLGKNARPLIDAATYTAKLENRRLNVLLDPDAREYVMAWVGKGKKAGILVLPLERFKAASGKL